MRLRREVTGDGDKEKGCTLPSEDLLRRHHEAVLLRVDELNLCVIQLLHVVLRCGFRRFELKIQCLFAGIDNVDFLNEQRWTTSVGIEYECRMSRMLVTGLKALDASDQTLMHVKDFRT